MNKNGIIIIGDKMNKIAQIIIIDKNYNSQLDDVIVINESVELIDEVTIMLSNKDIYNFDYLIFTSPSLITNFNETNILHDGGFPVTNYFHQTTYENIYYVTCDNIETALNNIFEEDC